MGKKSRYQVRAMLETLRSEENVVWCEKNLGAGEESVQIGVESE